MAAFAFGLAGMRYDLATGLYQTETVPYDPAIGQRLSEDQSGFASGTTNLYAMDGNNPTVYTDPSGECYSGLDSGQASSFTTTSASLSPAWAAAQSISRLSYNSNADYLDAVASQLTPEQRKAAQASGEMAAINDYGYGVQCQQNVKDTAVAATLAHQAYAPYQAEYDQAAVTGTYTATPDETNG